MKVKLLERADQRVSPAVVRVHRAGAVVDLSRAYAESLIADGRAVVAPKTAKKET